MPNSAAPNKDLHNELMQKVLDEAIKLLMENLPVFQKLVVDAIDLILAPKVVARQLALVMALEAGLVTYKQVAALVRLLVSNFSSRSRLIRQLLLEQHQAATQEEWMELAERIDQIQGNDIWRSDPSCALYERERISARIDEIVHLMRRQDIFELMFVLRGSIGRNKFGLLHEGLFTKAMAGTKVLVETYHNVICSALDFVCDAPVLPGEEQIPTEARLAFFNETRHSYGRTALLLSGGAALGFYHIGVVRTLMENNLMPRVIGGTSAGSIVCAMVGTRTDEECLNEFFQAKGTHAPGHSGKMNIEFFRPVVSGKDRKEAAAIVEKNREGIAGGWLEVYYNTAGAFHDAKRTLQGFMPIAVRRFTSTLYDVLTGSRRAQDVFKNDTEYFRNCLRENIGNFTFQEAFDRTGRILNIVVTPTNSSDPPRLLNYLTAPHVLVWSAAVASSSLPGVFEANRLVVKEADGWERYESGGGQHFADGSLEQDLPTTQLAEMFNVNHFIISQANPHAVMFASYRNRTGVWNNTFTGFLEGVLKFLRDQVRSWLLHLVDCVGARRIAPLFETSRGINANFFTQEYEGRSIDISLIPWMTHRGLFSALLHVIYNPCEAEYRDWIQAAARETWRYIPAIKSHIAEEVTLDRCVQRLRKRLVKESWDKRARAATKQKVNGRVPSFFTSPSLINMGGLNVSDQQNIEVLQQLRPKSKEKLHSENPDVPVPPPAPAAQPVIVVPDIDINSGWNGMGLRGNRSTNNLHRTFSDASGLFIDDEENAPVEQMAGEETSNERTPHVTNKKELSTTTTTNTTTAPPLRGSTSEGSMAVKSTGTATSPAYIKTSSMAYFYYRKNPSFLDTEHPIAHLHKTTSDSGIETSAGGSVGGGSGNNNNDTQTRHHRQRSRSHADLFAS